ncbi:MAG: triose-phosphate isomerase [Gemmatimonadota bacterium]|nr:triose-phosphate isomerase [Gemmatimonadota bacterium]
MRPKVIAGNWKMHHGPSATRRFFSRFFSEFSPRFEGAEPTILIFPPAISLPTAAESRGGRPEIGLGIQNIHWESKGALTGEHSASMALAAGARFALVGHSERRHVFGETDAQVKRKVAAAIRESLTPVVCVGETLDERRGGQVEEVIVRQLDAALLGVPEGAKKPILVAYEPVWAIGTGETATTDDVAEAHGILRRQLTEVRSDGFAQGVAILYGGSVKPDNAADLLAVADVDGVLVGAASLDPESFARIAESG